ncbi:hypothetical protein [Pedobacter sandarakinus]|uniref:hypothetical protein n=1 Tax=Pedobacter sandarakinus TaxID=353156 RepID=UPI002247ABE0|nr:hypothetical protein [Pedobacter sandarakinus]MCX2574687.1 hypothetical protein [Pedobacter sandarakinus]
MMNAQDIFKKVGHILTELNEQHRFLAQNPQELNDLELELFLANADFLADHIRVVQKLNLKAEPVKQASSAGLLAEQNTIILPETPPSYLPESESFAMPELEEIAAAEEDEERIDIKPEQEVQDDEKVKEDLADTLLERDFFKPDQEENTFEFVLGQHSEDDQFDYEAKPVEEIFDRPLSRAEEEILAERKKATIMPVEEEPLAVEDELVANDEDEIGPEPFLIAKQEETPIVEPKPQPVAEQLPETKAEQASPIAPLRDVKLDEPIISPPVAERPIFTPEAVPVRPVHQSSAPSLNELLAKTNSGPKADEPVKAPISDLKQAINLNEKLLFIKDLFKGYNLAYSEAIDIVNKMNSFEAADSFLQSNYAAKYEWANKQATVDQFYELLNRRFN